MRAGEPEFLYLTTTGRRSGQARRIEIWFTRIDGRFYVIAEHLWDAQWVQNVLADPRVQVRVGDDEFPARARVVNAGVEAALHEAVKELSEKKYGWGDGLVVELIHEPAS